MLFICVWMWVHLSVHGQTHKEERFSLPSRYQMSMASRNGVENMRSCPTPTGVLVGLLLCRSVHGRHPSAVMVPEVWWRRTVDIDTQSSHLLSAQSWICIDWLLFIPRGSSSGHMWVAHVCWYGHEYLEGSFITSSLSKTKRVGSTLRCRTKPWDFEQVCSSRRDFYSVE